MRQLILFVLMAISPITFAAMSGKVVGSTNNIPTAFDSTAGSLILDGCYGTKLLMTNESAGRIAVGIAKSGTVPSAVNFYIPAGLSLVLDPFGMVNHSVYIKSDTGAALVAATDIVTTACTK